MTDEEMAEEYICNGKCQDDITKNYVHCKTCTRIKAFLAGLKAGRPQWHDLRKDPKDLPKDTSSLYLVRVYSWDFGLSHLYKKYGTYIPTVCEWNGEYFLALDRGAYSNARDINSCIAWCEIPTFDKENEYDVSNL